jgi:protein O-mannosyl-transferase
MVHPTSQKRLNPTWIAGGIVAAVVSIFGRSCWFGFCNYDDPAYVTQNPHVQEGLSADGIRWAFSTVYYQNWAPLTWLSLQLDSELWGLNASGFHVTNLVLHGANALLLFFILRWTTGRTSASGCVAALFAIHPLHVESVVWISERKDVLSSLFWMLTLWAYAWYALRPGIWRYLLVAALLGPGLLAKSMLVTLPFVLLLMDYWPLERWRPATPGEPSPATARCANAVRFTPAPLLRLIGEKVPLLGISAAASVMTVVAQSKGGAVISTSQLPVADRLMTVPVAYIAYVAKTVMPTKLAVFYPYPARSQLEWLTAVAALFLVGLTIAVFLRWRRNPYLLVGWLWYLGTLVPVIGLVQVGQQGIADRYSYLPLIGIFVAIVWAVNDLVAARRVSPNLARILASTAIVSFGGCAWVQVGYWRDDVTLWSQAIAVSGPHSIPYDGLGHALLARGQAAEALPYLQQASRWAPHEARLHGGLCACLLLLGDYDEGKHELHQCLQLDPDNFFAHFHLGRCCLAEGKLGEAAEHLRQCLAAQPTNAAVQAALDEALCRQDAAKPNADGAGATQD